ncbi:hypothetical protein J6590_091901 [Homalodisca vitripennis]|nr:hypothetical protein J6590_091901 [Homalodisca vitripennis]
MATLQFLTIRISLGLQWGRAPRGLQGRERLAPQTTPELGAAGVPMATYDWTWEATKCLQCQSCFTLAKDLTDHHEDRHGDHLIRFRCTECRTLYKSYWGASVHLLKCIGSPVAIGFLCPDCGRSFPNKRGQGVHRSAYYSELVNAECLREEIRRAAGAAEQPPPTRPRSSGWAEDEDRTFIHRYLELKSTGRALGYFLVWYCLYAFVALELPRKTERERDAVRPHYLTRVGLLAEARIFQPRAPRYPRRLGGQGTTTCPEIPSEGQPSDDVCSAGVRKTPHNRSAINKRPSAQGPGSRCPSPRAAGRNLCPQGRPAAGGVGGLPATRTEQGGRMGGSPRGVGGATSLQFPKTPREIDSRKRRLKEEARLAWQAQVSQCVGVLDFKDNFWLLN